MVSPQLTYTYVLMKEKLKDIKKDNTVNTQALTVALLVFSLIVTVATLAAFFNATFTPGNTHAYNIASIYILFMILAVPTLTLFLDKPDCLFCKRLNKISIILIFATIVLITVVNVIVSGFGLLA